MRNLSRQPAETSRRPKWRAQIGLLLFLLSLGAFGSGDTGFGVLP